MEPVRLRIESLVHRGQGLARLDGKVWMVPFTVPGDEVEAMAVRSRPSLVEGRMTRLVSSGPNRVEPPCPWFGRCGGCHLQHLDSRVQAHHKAAVLIDTFRRIAHLDLTVSRVITGDPFGYRSRIELHAAAEGVGFFAGQSHRIVPIEACMIAQPMLSEAIVPLRCAMRETGMGPLCTVELVAAGSGDMVAVGRCATNRPDRLLAALMALPGVRGAAAGRPGQWQEWGDLEISWPTLAGVDRPVEARCDARGFAQANAGLNRGLVAAAMGLVCPQPGQRIVELYCGAGNLTLSLAAGGADVVAVEVDAGGIEAAEANMARLLPGQAARHVAGNVLTLLPRLAAQGPWDVVVADPPRTGLGPALDGVVALEAESVVMVSCDPATAARDVAGLVAAGYRVGECVLVDMFPQTWHMELVIGLSCG